jgi:hypothetical protein
MPRREILSPAQREALLVIPVDRAALIEHFVLSEQDLSLIRQRCGAQNRLGIAVQLSLLRFPGTALQADETPPQELINFWRYNCMSLPACETSMLSVTRRAANICLNCRTTTEFVHSLSASTARLPRGCCPLLGKPIEGSHWFARPSRNCSGGR